MPNQKLATAPAPLPDRDKRRAVRSVVTIAREFDQEAKRGNMNMTQYRIMLFLRNGPRRAGEVAATVLVKKATISIQIAAMKNNGWIFAECDSDDRRASKLVMTPKGRAEMDRLEERLYRCIEELLEPTDRRRFVRELSDLYSALAATRETRYADLGAGEQNRGKDP